MFLFITCKLYEECVYISSDFHGSWFVITLSNLEFQLKRICVLCKIIELYKKEEGKTYHKTRASRVFKCRSRICFVEKMACRRKADIEQILNWCASKERNICIFLEVENLLPFRYHYPPIHNYLAFLLSIHRQKQSHKKKETKVCLTRLHPRLQNNHWKYYVLILSHDYMRAWLLRPLRQNFLVLHKGDKLLRTIGLLKFTYQLFYWFQTI